MVLGLVLARNIRPGPPIAGSLGGCWRGEPIGATFQWSSPLAVAGPPFVDPLASPRATDARIPLVFLGAILPFVALVLWRISWAPDAAFGDYAQYVLHAQALLDGRSYADIGYLFHPEAPDIGPAAYPPGLPLLLLPIVAVTGTHPLPLRILMVACMIGFGWCAFRRLSRDLPASTAAVGVALALLSIEVQRGTVVPMSDPLFCVVLWLLFLVADTKERWSAGRTAMVTALGFALVAVRIAGAAIGPAVLLLGVLQRRRLGLRPFLVVAIWGAAALAALLVVSNPYSGNAIDRDATDLGRKLYFLAYNYRYALFEAELYPTGFKPIDIAYHLVITPVIAWGAVIALRRLGASLLVTFTISYVVLLLAVRFGAARFLWPLLPILGVSMVLGIAKVMELARRMVARPLTGSVASRAALFLPVLVLLGAFTRQLGAHAPFAITGTPDADALYSWMRSENARQPMRAMFHNPRVLTLSTGVPAMGILDRLTAGQLAAIDAEGLTHLVWQRADVSTCLQLIANDLPVRFPERFALSYENATFRVYRVRPAPAPYTGPWERLDWRHPPAGCVGG